MVVYTIELKITVFNKIAAQTLIKIKCLIVVVVFLDQIMVDQLKLQYNFLKDKNNINKDKSEYICIFNYLQRK